MMRKFTTPMTLPARGRDHFSVDPEMAGTFAAGQ